MNTLETYILNLIKKREGEFSLLQTKKEDYSEKDYISLYHRLAGQIDDLYMSITAHDNKYEKNGN